MKPPLRRRNFLRLALAAGAAAGLAPRLRAASDKVYRAAIIGRTGGGDYGHGYDQIFAGLEQVVVEAIADPDAAGRQKAAERSGARQQFSDFREMLRAVRPDLICIAPRHPDCHRDMALAALEVGRGLFMEKPLTETPAEADAILAAADRRGARIQVAHNRRWTREFVLVRALLAEGFAGTVREVRIQGKQDHRAGGEDLLVLGTHDFDLMRFYFGDPLWCFASVGAGGRDATRDDVRQGQEPIQVAGDTIHAVFGFPNNLHVSWTSVKTPDPWGTGTRKTEKWGFEILGTKRIIAFQSGIQFRYLDSPFFLAPGSETRWQPLPEPATFDWPEHARHPVRNLIHALESGGQPVCSGLDGRWAIEMVAAVYESHRLKARVPLPLQRRDNPLLRY